MKTPRRVAAALPLILILSACRALTDLAATAVPVHPTLAPGTGALTAPPLPTRTRPAPPSPLPTVTTAPSAPATPTLGPPPLPAEVILIQSIGPGSQITSPVTLSGIADPMFENQLAVQVLDQGGAIIGSGTAFISADAGQRGPFEATLNFTPPAETQPGRIVVFDTSARDGHIVHLASVNVTLLPAGAAPALQSAPSLSETIAIFSPAPNGALSGGIAHLQVTAGPAYEMTLNVSILDANGTVVGSGAIGTLGEVGNRFGGDVPYAVTGEQPGAVQVFAVSPRDGGMEHLASVNVTLQP